MTTYSMIYHNAYDGSAATNYSINSSTDRYIIAMHGFGPQGIEIPVQRAPYSHGAQVVGTPFPAWPPVLAADFPAAVPYFPPRTMELIVRLNCATTAALQVAYEALVRAVTPFAPVFQGDTSYLYITTPDGLRTRIIECYCTGVSDMEIKGKYHNAFVTLTFFAPIPFFHLPWGDAASSTAWSTGTNPVTINNPGDAPLWPIFKVFGRAGGTVAGLHLTNNTTGKIWSTSQTIATGATNYIVAYMDRAKMDYYNGSNADIINTLDTDAEFWPLQIGDNAVQFASTGTPSAITVYHLWCYNGL